MALLNTTGSIGIVIESFNNNITGGLFLTFLFILLIIIILLIAFRLPVEMIALIISPIVIILMTYMSEFYVIGGAILIMFAIIFATKFFIKT